MCSFPLINHFPTGGGVYGPENLILCARLNILIGHPQTHKPTDSQITDSQTKRLPHT